MNKYLEKIATEEVKKKEHIPSNTAIGVGTAMQASLPAVLGYNVAKEALGSGEVTGVQTLYHGTTPERASKIRAEGLKPGISTGMGAVIDKSTGTGALGSASHVFATRDKLDASGYVDSATRLQKAENPLEEGMRLARLNLQNPGKRLKDQYVQHAKSFTQGYGEGSPYLKLKVPLNAGLEKVVNPELEALKKDINYVFIPQARKNAIEKALGERTATFKGEVPTRYIVGSKDFKPTTFSDVMHHAKQHPRVAAAGVGKLVGGVGLMAASTFGGKALYEHRVAEAEKKRHEKVADDRSDLKINPVTASVLGGIGVSTGALLGYHDDPRRAQAIKDMKDAQDTLSKTKPVSVPKNPYWSTAEYKERVARANKDVNMKRLGANVAIGVNTEKLKEMRTRAGKIAAGGALLGAGMGYGAAKMQGRAWDNMPQQAVDNIRAYKAEAAARDAEAGSALPKVVSGALGGVATSYILPSILRSEHTEAAHIAATQKSLAKVLVPLGALTGYLKHKANPHGDE